MSSMEQTGQIEKTREGKKTKSDYVCDGIMENISSGVWPVGSKLPCENELTEIFGVSRISVRKAISQLSGRGILSAVQGGGTYVNEVLPGDYLSNALQMIVMDSVDYQEIQEFRLLLEPEIAFYAATKITASQLEEIHACIERQETAEQNHDLDAYLKEDMRFHNLIASGMHNGLTVKVLDLLQDLLWLGMHQSGKLTGFKDGIRFHKEICNCLEQRDAQAAKNTMWYHIHNNILVVPPSEEADSAKDWKGQLQGICRTAD